METWGVLALGLVALVAGGELLVRGASRLSGLLGISPVVVGLTVVAFGTSAPEMAVSVQSAATGSADLALGNVLGSNIFNVLVILGLSALVTPLVVAQQFVRQEVPLLLAVSLVTWLFCLDGAVGWTDGLLLFGGAVAYTVWTVRESRREQREVVEEYAEALGAQRPSGLVSALLVLGGLVLLVLGSRWLVGGATTLARSFGVGELVIGLTIVAAGTSLPEVATSVVAAARGERDIAVGNVIGSNLFNLLAVLGLSALVVPGGVPVAEGALAVDLPVMAGVSLACLPILFTGGVVDRWEGALFLAGYVAYAAWLVLGAMEHPVTPVYGAVIGSWVLPAVVVLLALLAIGQLRRARAEAS